MDVGDLRSALRQHPPRLLEAPGKTPAAVAAVLAADDPGPRLLLIERTRHPDDPWSGHLAFPGGRLEPEDAGPREAAERETREEVGIELSAGELLGRLDDVTGSTLPVHVAAFVYALPQTAPVVSSAEVREAFWVPVGRLLDPGRQVQGRFPFRGLEERLLPAIDLLGPGRPLLWGITYRLVAQLLALAGYPLPRAGAPL